MSSVHTFLSETAPTKHPRSPLPHPQRGWGTGRTVRSPEPAASARSPEASSLSPGLVFYRSRSLDFKEILFSFFSSSQTHHKYILVRGESYRSLPLCCPRWRVASCSAARNSGECWAALGCFLPAKVFPHWEGSCSVPRGSEQTEPWTVVSKYLGARQEMLPPCAAGTFLGLPRALYSVPNTAEPFLSCRAVPGWGSRVLRGEQEGCPTPAAACGRAVVSALQAVRMCWCHQGHPGAVLHMLTGGLPRSL